MLSLMKGQGMNKRTEREKRTVSLMIGMHCRHNHPHGNGLCEECAALQEYAMRRTEACRFGSDKPVCSACPVHCYKPGMRERIRGVMRYAGPRMIWHHPGLAVLHLIDKRRDARMETKYKKYVNHERTNQ